jgi:amino acid transporter
MADPVTLARRQGLPEALGLSIAVVAPSVGMAFNVVLSVQVAGAAAPLTFLIGTVVMLVVALSFVAFSRRQPHAGAAYAYIAHAFGPWLGVAAGWTMLLAYLGYCTSMGGLIADFLITGLAEAGVHADAAALPIGVAAILVCAWLAWRDARTASRVMLVLELVSMAAILVLALAIFVHVNAAHRWSSLPFRAHAAPGGMSALGYGLVFAILSFAGFEGAATLSEETEDPRRTVPLAMLGSVLGSGLFFVVVSYAVVLGFGTDRMSALAASQAPLDELARTNIGPGFALALDLANTVSAFSCILGSLSAAARLLFALGRAGLSRSLATVDSEHRTPARAVVVCTLVALVPFCASLSGVFGGRVQPGDYYGYLSTIATLALILVYGAVTVAESVEAARLRRVFWALLGGAGALCLAWALVCSIIPVPAPPANLWPVLVLGWVCIGLILPVIRPRLKAA